MRSLNNHNYVYLAIIFKISVIGAVDKFVSVVLVLLV